MWSHRLASNMVRRLRVNVPQSEGNSVAHEKKCPALELQYALGLMCCGNALPCLAEWALSEIVYWDVSYPFLFWNQHRLATTGFCRDFLKESTVSMSLLKKSHPTHVVAANWHGDMGSLPPVLCWLWRAIRHMPVLGPDGNKHFLFGWTGVKPAKTLSLPWGPFNCPRIIEFNQWHMVSEGVWLDSKSHCNVKGLGFNNFMNACPFLNWNQETCLTRPSGAVDSPARCCQDAIIFEDLFASFDVMIAISKEAPAQGADSKARDALHECQQTKRPEKHVDGSCQTLRQQLQGWQNTSTKSNTDNQGKNWWLQWMHTQALTEYLAKKHKWFHVWFLFYKTESNWDQLSQVSGHCHHPKRPFEPTHKQIRLCWMNQPCHLQIFTVATCALSTATCSLYSLISLWYKWFTTFWFAPSL